MLIRKRKAQSTAEYAIVFAIVIAAATAMQVYIRRSMNAKFKDGADAISQQGNGKLIGDYALAASKQYEPYYTQRDITTTTSFEVSNSHYENQLESSTYDKAHNTDATVVESVVTDPDNPDWDAVGASGTE